MKRSFHSSILFLLLLLAVPALGRAAEPIDAWIQTIQAVGPEGQGNAAASKAWQQLSQTPAEHLPAILTSFSSANDLAANWLRSTVEAVVDRALAGGDSLPMGAIAHFLLDTRHDARARGLAFEIVQRAHPDTAREMTPGLLSDPNPSLRRLAVQEWIEKGDRHAQNKDAAAATLIYRQALGFARDAEQVRHLADALNKFGLEIDLPSHFGFLMKWLVIGPFHNNGREGFHTVFEPEKELNLQTEYQGKNGLVPWTPYATEHEYGMVDVNTVCGHLKEVTAYAYTEFHSERGGPAELRLGCKNAWKIWCNGQFLFGRDEYHRGAKIDQYTMPVTLHPGKNTILVKICQDEQVEEWTKEWEFQLRVCDATGTAILSTLRPPPLEKNLNRQLSLNP